MNQQENDPRPHEREQDIIAPIAFQPLAPAVHLPRLKLPWAHGLIALLLMIGFWGAWYVVTARSIRVDVHPSNALVSFDELFAPSIGDHWVLRPGKRTVFVEAPGYRPYRGDLMITDEPLQTHTITLNPLPGHLTVAVTPVATARVTIDQLIEAIAPTTISNIDAGPREITVYAKRYLPFSTVIEIEGRGIEQQLMVSLRPAWADVTIRSEPSGATVNVDAAPSDGTTPLKLELLQGDRTISVLLEGYKPWQKTLQVVAGVALNLPSILLEKADGYIAVISTPSGATITVDSKFKGRSPLNFSVTPDEKHRIRARKEGYKAASQTITIGSGETENIDLRLQAELAAVQIITTPSDAELIVDGVSLGAANQTIKLATHAHRIEIKKRGFVSYHVEITPRKGIRKRIKVRLKTPAEAAASAAQGKKATKAKVGVIATFVGQQLKLFRGGDVKMGSSRRDPNRRANEILRDASLVRPFYLGVHEVTNSQFRRFLAHHRAPPVKGVDVDGDEHPIINVNWESAALFCNWLSRKDSLDVFYQIKNSHVLGINPAALGYRLPTEAEWTWVARSAPKSKDYFEFPWAGKFPPRGRSGNYADQSASHILGQTITDYDDGFAVTAPVGSFLANLHGIHDLGGNVSEWINDYYAAVTVQAAGAIEDPLGPRTGNSRVIRGSNWTQATVSELRFAYRDFGNNGRDDVGFRIARYAQ